MKKLAFNEKLQIISNIYFEEHKKSFLEDEIVSIENKFKIAIPKPLKDFYLMFGEDLDLLKCMYDIASPKELYVENNVLMIAKEYQNVCGYGISLVTQKPIYFDNSNSIIKVLNQNIEDFLIYLLAVQGTEYLNCVGKIDISFIDELNKCLFRITDADDEGAVYCSKDGIIGVVVSNEILISAQNDDCMENFENISGLEIDLL